MPTNGSLNRKLRMALVGGGQGAFIGRVHATAAVLDNRAALVAGALSSDPAKAKASAPRLRHSRRPAPTARIKELIEKEKALPADQRIDFVSVATPNHTHFEIAKAAVEAGFNVICDKPMTFDLAQAEAAGRRGRQVRRRLRRHAQLHRLSAGAAGPRDDPRRRAGRDQRHPLVLHPRLAADAARERATRSRPPGGPIPSKSGAAGCFGDIATHAYNLARYMTGLLPDTDQLPPEDLRPKAASSTTTARPSSASRTARSAPSPPRRSATAARTTCSSRSTARRARSNGGRKSRTR